MIAPTAERVKTTRRAVEITRNVRAIVYDDLKRARRQGDRYEEARCRAEIDQLDAEIDRLTDGRGW